MPRPRALQSLLAALALLLPLGLAAAAMGEEAAPGDAASGAGAKAAEPEKPADPAAQVARGISGEIVYLTKQTIAVRNLEAGSGGRTVLTLGAGADTRVTGEKKSFADLRRGDLVAVAYQGTPPRATGIQVLPREVDPRVAATRASSLYQKPGREFIGWIKKIDAQTMVVRTPDGPKGSRHKGEVKAFARKPDTVVELERSSWETLKKGDRVAVAFEKGEPRPAVRVTVLLRGGEKPLPAGLATRLYDPAYDRSVDDVDGIGEWPPGVPWPAGDEKAASGAADAQKPAPAPAPAR